MSIAALFERLTDFAPHAPEPVEIDVPDERYYPKAVPTPDIPAIVAAAVSTAEAELEARLGEQHQAELQAQRQRHAEEVAAFAAELGADIGTAIATRLGEMESRIVQFTTQSAARVVAGLVSDDIARRSVDALAKAILEAIADKDVVRIKINGPQYLFDALSLALGERASSTEFAEAPGFDLSVSIDDNLFETRLGEWSTALTETLP